MTLYMQCECSHSMTADSEAALVTSVVSHVQQTHPAQMHRIYRDCLNQLYRDRTLTSRYVA